MSRAVVTLLLLVLATLVPSASAQVPQPQPVVDQACDTVRGPAPAVADAVPLCPAAAPAAPAAPQHDHDHGAPAPPPANPQDAPALAQSIAEQAQQVPQDPQGAPDHVLVIVETIIQFVKDVLSLPALAGHGIAARVASYQEALAHAADAARAKAAATAEVAKAGIAEAKSTVMQAAATLLQLLSNERAPSTPVTPAPARPTTGDASSRVHGILQKLPVTVGGEARSG